MREQELFDQNVKSVDLNDRVSVGITVPLVRLHHTRTQNVVQCGCLPSVRH